jgi:replicative DNA helicase
VGVAVIDPSEDTDAPFDMEDAPFPTEELIPAPPPTTPSRVSPAVETKPTDDVVVEPPPPAAPTKAPAQTKAKKSKAKDENDRLIEGTLPENPGDDAVPMPVQKKARETAMQLATTTTPPTTSTPAADAEQMPSNPHAEMTLLACLLWAAQYDAAGPCRPALIADLIERPIVIFTPAHRWIWEAMLACSERGAPCDVTAVYGELAKRRREKEAGGVEYLEQLVAAASPTTDVNLREYAGIVREAWMRRILIEAGHKLVWRARHDATFAAEIAADYAVKMNDFAGKHARDASYVHIKTSLKRTVDNADKPTSLLATSTGLKKLDHLLIGGWRRTHVSILAARTSVGKSAMALEFAVAVAKADPTEGVLYVSLEMNDEAFTQRMVSSRARVEARTIMTGGCTPEEKARVNQVYVDMDTQEIFFNAKMGLTLAQIRGLATKVARELASRGKRLALIIIDHLGLIKPGSRKPSREQEVAETSGGLRVLAADFDCHVIALAQINRKAEEQTGKDKMPMLHHLRDSGCLEQDADNVLILHRRRDPKTQKFVEGEWAKLGVAKARGAEIGMVYLAVSPKYVRFEAWENSEQAKARKPGSAPSSGNDDDDGPADYEEPEPLLPPAPPSPTGTSRNEVAPPGIGDGVPYERGPPPEPEPPQGFFDDFTRDPEEQT